MARSKSSDRLLKEHFDDGWVQRSHQEGCRSRASVILPMDPVSGVDVVQGDFTDQSFFEGLMAVLDGGAADIVISDMAPNMCGNPATDRSRAMARMELALQMATQVLRHGGVYVATVFQGEGFDVLLAHMKQNFASVVSHKPDSSRARSREIYQVCKGFRG